MKLLIAVLALTLAACTTPVQLPPTSGPKLVITRDSGFVGGGCKLHVALDNKPAGSLSSGETLVLNTGPGLFKVNISLCNTELSTRVNVNSEPAVLRASISGNMQVSLTEVTP